MRVLVVEDDAELADRIAEDLRLSGMVVDIARDGNEADFMGCTEAYDAAVLDLGLPGLDGVSVLRSWREHGRDMPVLILTARGRWSDKLAGFDAGADDYLTKPFLHEEVALRLRVLTRRARGHAHPLITVGPLSYDSNADRFMLEGRPLVLTAQEQLILAYLIQRHGCVVSRSEIAEHVYARDLDPDSNTLDVMIGRIRRRLGHPLIHTERGRGYRLADDSGGDG
ncbi:MULTISPECIES: response regulator transcription factor [unclassified Thauera]|uniref:response regulator transcription factor n=1 Tax=unclassified Thauera TaxID=2609274 RepID=UPI0021E168D3|nr:response regulator transcription factor [Thauera sp. Sel9]MCV2216417.1 response regulator transcription factor [Thauera sp. Sel9]